MNNATRLNEKGVRYSGIIRWNGDFDIQEKNEIRNNLNMYAEKSDKYIVIIKPQYVDVSRNLKLRDGMDTGQFEWEPPDINDWIYDELMSDPDITMNDIVRLDRRVNQDLGELQHIPKEVVLAAYTQESIRVSREDTRHDQKILRQDNIICIRANIAAIGNNLGQLTQAAAGVATTNINWNPEAPMAVFRNIFENIIDGW
jgi:hypothetical protein